MPGGRDPRGAVDVDADVALVGHERLAGVEPHPHADRPVRRAPPCPRAAAASASAARGEGDEERVALRVDLDAAVPLRTPRAARAGARRALRVPLAGSWSSRVEPSMSVKRKVTVPVGSSRIAMIMA